MTIITSLLNLFQTFKQLFVFILGALGLFLMGRNSKLAKENEKLNTVIKDNNKIIKMQDKVIHAVQNHKPCDLGTNIKRMYEDKL